MFHSFIVFEAYLTLHTFFALLYPPLYCKVSYSPLFRYPGFEGWTHSHRSGESSRLPS